MRAILYNLLQVAERVDGVVGDVAEAAGVFDNLNEAPEAVGGALTFLSGLVCDRGCAAGILGE